MAMMPRAKFLANLYANVIGAGLAAALGTLIVYAAVKARLNTTPALPPGVTPPAISSLANVPYNSSASAISGVFFFFAVYLANVLRAKLPQVVFAVMIFSIIITVVCAEAPKIPTVAFALTFITTLLKAFYFGMAIGAAVSLIVIPVSCRTVVIKQFTAFLGAMQKGLEAHKVFFESMQDKENIFALLTIGGTIPAVGQVKASIAAMSELNSKLQVDLPFAKREVGIGRLGGDEMKELNKLGRLTMLPILGLSSVSEVLQRFAISRGWRVSNIDTLSAEEQKARQQAVDEWAQNFKIVHEQFSEIIDVLKDGLDHVAYQLQLKPRPKRTPNPDSGDVEGAPDKTAPGEPGFAQYLDEKSTKFYSSKHLMLTDWARSRGFQFADDFFDHPQSSPVVMSDELKNASELRHQVNQRQVFLLLYMEFLLYATARSLLDLVIWTDKIVSSGIMKRNRLIIPNFKRMRKLLGSTFNKDELATDQTELSDLGGSVDYTVQMGSAFGAQKDPEHLPPKNAFERAGNIVRGIPRFFKSDESAFGFRVACASMSIGIILFLEASQKFAFEYRLLWAVIMTAISMSPSAGQSVLGFILRVLGTFLAMLFSWFIWFVPGNGKTPGVLVFYWLFVFFLFWIPLKRPQFAMVGVITIVTITLTIGYQLEKNKIGEFALSATSGQVYLSALIIGPVRLATVTAGLFVAFFWTMFPYPTEEHSIIRRDAAASLHLLAAFHSLVHETVTVRIRQVEGNLEDKNSAGRRLESARLRTFDKQVLLLNSMKQNIMFQKWEFSLGGRFPSEKYEAIIQAIQR
jgi:hypothetical protein